MTTNTPPTRHIQGQSLSGLDTSAGHSNAWLMTVLIFQQLAGSVAFPIAKFGLAEIEPYTYAFYRFVITSVTLLAIVWLSQPRVKVERRDLLKIFGLGVMIVPFNQTAFLVGQSMTGAGHASLIFATTPIWVFVLALIHLKEPLRWRRAIGVVVAVAGVVVIMFGGAVSLGTEYLIGDLFILIAVLAWSYYTILGKPLVQKYGALRVTAYALAFGSTLYVPFGLYRALSFDYSGVSPGAWGSVLYMALGVSGVVYLLWYWLLKHMPASRIAVWHNIQPLAASGVALVWLGEPLTLAFVVGGIVVLAGVVTAEWPTKRPLATSVSSSR